MALPESLSVRKPENHFYNDNDSYTRLGALAEISKHVILVPNHQGSLGLMAEAKKLKLIPRTLEINQGIALLCLPEIETYDEPAMHNNNSEAGYSVDKFRYKANDGRENIIYVSNIPARGKTGRPAHTHGEGINGRGIYEHYFLISGTAFIGENEKTRLMKEYEVVPPNTEHPIKAGDEGAVFFILLENVDGIPDDQIHIHKGASSFA